MRTRCDLLKIHYLCGRNDNRCFFRLGPRAVVICSKFITFVVEMTTLLILQNKMLCCDLLKIHYLCGRNDNKCASLYVNVKVVICSKFITFVVEMTTDTRSYINNTML